MYNDKSVTNRPFFCTLTALRQPLTNLSGNSFLKIQTSIIKKQKQISFPLSKLKLKLNLNWSYKPNCFILNINFFIANECFKDNLESWIESASNYFLSLFKI